MARLSSESRLVAEIVGRAGDPGNHPNVRTAADANGLCRGEDAGLLGKTLIYNGAMPRLRSSWFRTSRQWPHAVLALTLASVAVAAPVASRSPPEKSTGWLQKEPVTGHRDMVAAANPLAVAAGLRVLHQGGSAVDAAIAVQLVLNLVEP